MIPDSSSLKAFAKINSTEVPSELERIINRALEKDRELRYQHASDMKSELLRLKRDTDTGRTRGTAQVLQWLCERKHIQVLCFL